MGAVYAATDVRSAGRVAVKVLHREFSLDPGLRARFLREGDATNRVEHPGTVRVLEDDAAEDGSLFIVMDLLEGETVHARWVRSGCRLEAPEVVTLLAEVLDVLGAAHDKGVVHRDLEAREPVFHARWAGEGPRLRAGPASRELGPADADRSGVRDARLHVARAGARQDERDRRAIGPLGGRGHGLPPPFGSTGAPGKHAGGMLLLSATRPAPLTASVVHDVPPLLAAIINRALAFDKADRWPSARAMRAALLESGGQVPSASRRFPRRACSSARSVSRLRSPRLSGRQAGRRKKRRAALSSPPRPAAAWSVLHRDGPGIGGVGVRW